MACIGQSDTFKLTNGSLKTQGQYHTAQIECYVGDFAHNLTMLTALLFEDTVTVGIEEFLQIGNLGTQFFTFVGIGHSHAVG